MTHAQWVELTPTQQRVLVALHRGWTGGENGDWIDPDGDHCQALYPSGEANGKLVGMDKYDGEVPPDYLDDLNAMHQCMVLIRDRGLFATYYTHLRDIFSQRGLCFSTWDEQNTSAEIRAEAFVTTMEGQ